MPRRTWKTHEGEQLDLNLNIEEMTLFDQAHVLYVAGAGMDEISQLYLDGTCVLYKGRTGAEVVTLPVYRAIKDMAKRRGIAAGLLADGPGSRPGLDAFKARN